jgi:CBS domain-containing protein
MRGVEVARQRAERGLRGGSRSEKLVAFSSLLDLPIRVFRFTASLYDIPGFFQAGDRWRSGGCAGVESGKFTTTVVECRTDERGVKSDTIIDGLELHQIGEYAGSRIGLVIDRHEHFFYADQSRDEARRLMEDLGLKRLPLVDRSLRIVAVLGRNELG